MARVELARTAVDDLDRLVRVLSLPADTRGRVRSCLEPLAEFPRLGQELTSRWEGLRFVLGPWRWMLLIYEYLEAEDRVIVVTIQDTRTSAAVTSE